MSETPQQHGWQPPDLNDPAEDAARRGFGVFEAPSVPDDFPAFTPYSSATMPRQREAAPEGEQPSAFPGYPSEESSSYVPAPAVVPIPGVPHEPFPSEPISPASFAEQPDPSIGGAAGSWAAFAAGDTPKPPTSSPKPWEELSPFEASLDAAAASSSSSSSYEPASYEPASYEPASYEPSSYEPASYEPASYEPSSYEPSSYEASSSYGASSYEASSYDSSAYEAPSSPGPSSFESPYKSPLAPSYRSSYESPPLESQSSMEAPPFESSSKAPQSSPSSEAEPAFTPPPPPPPPATGSVRVAAAVPPGSRVEPEDLSEAASQTPKPAAGRVYGSASVSGSGAIASGSVPVSPGQAAVYASSTGVYGQPVDLSATPGSPGVAGSWAAMPESAGAPGSPAAMPGSPGAAGSWAAMPESAGAPGSPAAMPGSPGAAGSWAAMPGSPGAAAAMPGSPGMPVSPAPMPVPAQGNPSTGMVRATARVTGTAQPNPGEAVPVAKSSTVYGSATAAAAAPADAPAQGRPGRPHTFGDLLEPAAAPPSIPMQRGPQSPQSPQSPQVQAGAHMPPAPPAPPMVPQGPGQPVPAVQPVQPVQPAQAGQPFPVGQPFPAGQPAGQPPGQPFPGGQPGQPFPVGLPGQPGQQVPGRPITGEVPEPKPERKVRLILGVVIGCVLLLAVAFGGLVLIDQLVRPPFAVGDCVKQSPDKQEAIAATCTDEGAYKVVSSVGSADECDKEQPYVKIKDEILCLQPATQPAPQ